MSFDCQRTDAEVSRNEWSTRSSKLASEKNRFWPLPKRLHLAKLVDGFQGASALHGDGIRRSHHGKLPEVFNEVFKTIILRGLSRSASRGEIDVHVLHNR